MTDTKVLDTSAWIEYFLGTQKGLAIKEQIKDSRIIIVSPCLAEVFSWALRQEQDFTEILLVIRQLSTIFEPTTNDWVTAAHKKQQLRKTKKKIGLFDTILLSVQETFDATLLTTDNDFRG